MNPKFLLNNFHTILYRSYVLLDDTVPTPPARPPYYSVEFFNSIRWVKEKTPLNVATMSTSQWYRVLLEKEVTMAETDDHNMEYIKSRAELASPSTDWELTWTRSRLKGLGSEATSFLWKLLYKILPTEEIVARILINSSLNCKLCPNPVVADLEHSFFNCVSTQHVGRSLLSAVRHYAPEVTPSGLLRLEFDEQGENEMPLVWIISHALLYMWGVRLSGKSVDLNITRSLLESKINLLRETRYQSEHRKITEILEHM